MRKLRTLRINCMLPSSSQLPKTEAPPSHRSPCSSLLWLNSSSCFWCRCCGTLTSPTAVTDWGLSSKKTEAENRAHWCVSHWSKTPWEVKWILRLKKFSRPWKAINRLSPIPSSKLTTYCMQWCNSTSFELRACSVRDAYKSWQWPGSVTTVFNKVTCKFPFEGMLTSHELERHKDSSHSTKKSRESSNL